MFPCFRKCQHTIPRIFLFDGCEADTSQHSPRKSYVPSWVLKCIKQTDSPLVWSLTSEFYPSGTPIPPIFHGFDITFSAMCCCAKCTKAHNAQSMLRTEGMALRSWRSWRQLFLAVLGVFAKTMILILFALQGFLHTVLAKSTTQKCLVWDAVVSFAPAIPLPTAFIRNMLCHANVANGGVLKLCMSARSLSVCPKPPTQKLEDLYWMVCTWTAPTKLLLHEFCARTAGELAAARNKALEYCEGDNEKKT